ncbi:alkaline phosphatase family protein [Acidicapsa ligni]|uniref:alkaline phosphatase family protein n=1 Tax=Acidicapsa ligni TaxID=542300 RepID=UPI0021DF9A80|nr:alkaline phosphatase family protein [Acidicapsa ligni]
MNPKICIRRFLYVSFLSLSSLLFVTAATAQTKTKNVVLIVTDGLRWEDVFTGADATLMNEKDGGIWADPKVLNQQFWNNDPVERRKMLLPFLWGTVAKEGQIYGNQHRGSVAQVSNGLAFSYPGYNEMTTGHPDPRIDSNEFGTNPNLTVFEWLNRKPEYHGQVAVFATWNVFEDIFNEKRSNLVMQAGWNLKQMPGGDASQQQLLEKLFKTTTRFDADDTFDSFLQIPLLDYVRNKHPKVLFVGYGETDNWAHSGRYDLVLESANKFDHFVEELWNTMQAMPEYHDQTTFIITTDHGRGHGLTEWKEHGVEEKGSENIWMGIIGPDTPALGERSNTSPVIQAQIAATIAAFLGQDFRHDVPEAAPAIQSVLGSSAQSSGK